ncbi:MAG TPA: 6-bladed beta-propeller [Longimicrobium sp.]|nr:6-bladed beta-propeller [Longimicrobium sp.]
MRDSAGITIVQNDAPAWKKGQEWRVSADPLLDVGEAEGDPNEQFARVTDALRLSDGTLLVGDGQANEIRAFDAQGKYLRTVGRKGGGPGEFTGLFGMHLLPGDTVAAYDYQSNRLSFFSPSGALARSVTLREMNGKLPPRPIGIFSDGRILVTPLYDPNFKDSSKPVRDTAVLAVFSAAGTQAASLGSVPGDETVTITGGTGNNRMMLRSTPPFGLSTSFGVHGTRLLIGDPVRYELVERRPDGTVARLIRRSGEREPVTQADRDAYLERQGEGMNDARFRPLHEQLEKQTVFPERKPFFTGLVMDAAGNAWVRRPSAPETEAPWDVFDPEGRLLGTVTTPAGFRVTQIGEDFIVGTWEDEMDVPHVRIHRLEKPAAR